MIMAEVSNLKVNLRDLERMEAGRKFTETFFTSVMALNLKRGENIPKQYVLLPPLQRPNHTAGHISTAHPFIDLSMLNQPARRSQLVDEVRAACKNLGFFQTTEGSRMEPQRKTADGSFTSVMALNLKHGENIPEGMFFLKTNDQTLAFQVPLVDEVRAACKKFGCFQVINHGIPTSLMKDALDSAEEFFNLPNDEKLCFASTDVRDPIRYGTSINHGVDKVLFWRDFIKHYANPVSEWIHIWPTNPPSYKDKMGSYSKAAHILQMKITEIVLESLDMNANYLHDDLEEGSQVIAVNCYPPCPEPGLALGMPSHTDYGTLTILNQSQQGLEIMDHDGKWHPVPFVEGSLIVQLGDQFEVMSNGRYKSTPHRATLSLQMKRLSIASLHSLAIEKKVGPAPHLIDEQRPIAYKEGSFGEFLNFINTKSLSKNKYIDTLKIPCKMVREV